MHNDQESHYSNNTPSSASQTFSIKFDCQEPHQFFGELNVKGPVCNADVLQNIHVFLWNMEVIEVVSYPWPPSTTTI
jgi:hypothetical protein